MTIRKLERVIASIPASDGAGVKLRRSLGEKISARSLQSLVHDGLIDEDAAQASNAHPQGRAVLTLRGRLLADAVTRRLAP